MSPSGFPAMLTCEPVLPVKRAVALVLLAPLLEGCAPGPPPPPQTSATGSQATPTQRHSEFGEPKPSMRYNYITCLAVSPDGGLALTGSSDTKALTLWDLASPRKV